MKSRTLGFKKRSTNKTFSSKIKIVWVSSGKWEVMILRMRKVVLRGSRQDKGRKKIGSKLGKARVFIFTEKMKMIQMLCVNFR